MLVWSIRNVNYDKRLKRCGEVWWKKYVTKKRLKKDEKMDENRFRLI